MNVILYEKEKRATNERRKLPSSNIPQISMWNERQGISVESAGTGNNRNSCNLTSSATRTRDTFGAGLGGWADLSEI